jgi:phospholipase C
MDNPSSMLAGEAFLERVFTAYRSATSETGPNVWNTPLLIGWDEPGGTYDHVPPGPVPPPDPTAPPGELGFTFDRSGYRVLAIIVSPWVEPGSAYNEEYRHTSLIATLRKAWGLGHAFTQRDAAARTFDQVFSLVTPRDPQTWATLTTRPVPEWTMDLEVVGQALSTLGKGLAPALIARAKELGVPLSAELTEPGAELPRGQNYRRPAAGRRGTSSPSWRETPQTPAGDASMRSGQTPWSASSRPALIAATNS